MKPFHVENLLVKMRPTVVSLILICVLAADATSLQTPSKKAIDLTGRWQVTFVISGGGATTLEFQAQSKGNGSFLLREAQLNSETSTNLFPATWWHTTNDRINFSGEIELRLSPCCLETGTLIFKGRFKSSNSITGKAIFVGTTENEENCNGYVSTVGTFTATRMPISKSSAINVTSHHEQ